MPPRVSVFTGSGTMYCWGYNNAQAQASHSNNDCWGERVELRSFFPPSISSHNPPAKVLGYFRLPKQSSHILRVQRSSLAANKQLVKIYDAMLAIGVELHWMRFLCSISSEKFGMGGKCLTVTVKPRMHRRLHQGTSPTHLIGRTPRLSSQRWNREHFFARLMLICPIQVMQRFRQLDPKVRTTTSIFQCSLFSTLKY